MKTLPITRRYRPFRNDAPPARAFTLIELMIVVAIISILAAIALPNFLEAQGRAKASRAKADMRTIAIGLEAWAVDNDGYPSGFGGLRRLTRPVEYLTVIPDDIFAITSRGPGGQYRYGSMPLNAASRWALLSVGLDTDMDVYLAADTGSGLGVPEPDFDALRFYPGYSPALFSEQGVQVNDALFRYVIYDPTNGTMSSGDIFRLSDKPLP